MAKEPHRGKGTYGDLGLPVAEKYLYPGSRRRLLLAGAAGALVVLAVAAASFFLRDGAFFQAGPLSSAHAISENDCSACHQPFGAAASERCSACHETTGDDGPAHRLGVFSFASHYLYRSQDFNRLVPSEHETACSACHLEHLGREAAITRVGDGRCLTCHDVGSFNREHPQFDFVAESLPDDETLKFPHIHHVREVMQRQGWSGAEQVEQACLVCHNPGDDGAGFQPIDFDRHCDACHLTATEKTPRLPVRQPGEEVPGVLTLAAFQESGGPAARWAFYTDPNEYRQLGSGLVKSPLHHNDRWVLENLRALRRMLYPDAGLADLLDASAEVDAADTRELYREAIATLEQQAVGLRGRPEPEVQAELGRVTALLAGLERALEDPTTPLDETAFLLALGERPKDSLSAGEVEEIETVIADLTATCRRCHLIDRATIARVREDQDLLRRAEFDHRAHVLQVRCLECHAEIPVLEHLEGTPETDPPSDRAATRNLPRIENCQRCHNPRQTSNRCVTCHQFHPNKNRHPDKSRRSALLLNLSAEEERDDASQAVLPGG